MYFLGSLIVASADGEPGPEEGAPLRLESKVFKGRPAGGQERRYHSDRMLAYWEVSPVSEASLLCQCWSSDSALLPCYVAVDVQSSLSIPVPMAQKIITIMLQYRYQ